MLRILPGPFLCIVATKMALIRQRMWFDALEQHYLPRTMAGQEYERLLKEFAPFLPVYNVCKPHGRG